MPSIALDFTGYPKGLLVEGGYDLCGLAAPEYQITPEEVERGIKRLDALMALLLKKGIDLGYNFPVFNASVSEEASGIPDDAVEPVQALLAKRLAPSLGATLSAEAKGILATALSDLMANYSAAPPSRCPTVRMRSMGTRRWGGFTDLNDDSCADAD